MNALSNILLIPLGGSSGDGPAPGEEGLLLEDGDFVLLEDGSFLLLEG